MDPLNERTVTLDPAVRKTYSVSQLNREIRMRLETAYPAVWLEAELSNVKFHSSGHMYLTLKDEKSQISAVFFSRYNRALKFKLKDGLQVLVYGKVSLYEPRGQYQFYVERIEPKGMGALQLAFLQLKEKLQKEGLFKPEHKKPLPLFPRAVGVVTSPTGAAIRDILNVVNRRFRGTEVLIYPVQVQGEGAAAQIAEAVRSLNEYGRIDVMIVGRGGGSLEDLWAFNEEIVARAVFESKIPVISAVGHEIDWTICDLAADLRAPTPSAAAELVVQNREELEVQLDQYQTRMRDTVLNLLEVQKERLRMLEESYAFRQPLDLVQQFYQRVDELCRQLQNYAKTLVLHRRQEFRASVGKLEALSPLSILNRGYSLTFDARGKLVCSLREVKVGDKIQTQVAKGKFASQVTDIQRERG